MKIFMIIIGVLMALCGISCMCTPVITFLEAGYFLVIDRKSTRLNSSH